MRDRRTRGRPESLEAWEKVGRIAQIRELLTIAEPLRLSKRQLSDCIADCRKDMRLWKGKRANFKSLVSGRIAREVVLHALEFDDPARVWCVDDTNIITAYGINVRVQAVCGRGRAVLVDPENKVPIDLIVAIRVRFRHNKLKEAEFEHLGNLEWDKVATNTRFVPAGSTVRLLPTDDQPRKTVLTPSKACYVILPKDLMF